MYAEIEQMLPVFKFSLATQKKGSSKSGMNSLRQAVSTSDSPTPKSQSELDEYAKKFYEWLDPQKRSTIRLCMHWQASSVSLLIFVLVKYEFSKCKAMLFCGQCSSCARQLGV